MTQRKRQKLLCKEGCSTLTVTTCTQHRIDWRSTYFHESSKVSGMAGLAFFMPPRRVFLILDPFVKIGLAIVSKKVSIGTSGWNDNSYTLVLSS